MSKTDKELVSELTITFIKSWSSKTNNPSISVDNAVDIFNNFKELIESMENDS